MGGILRVGSGKRPLDIHAAEMPGVFKLPPRECMQKVAALYSLAMQATLFDRSG